MTTSKFAIASIAAAGLGGGVGLSSSSAKNKPEDEEEVDLISIKASSEYKNDEDKSKFGGKYSYYFLSSKDVRNKKFWDGNARELNKENKGFADDSFFKDNKGKWTGDLLKRKCEEQYEKSDFNNSEKKWKEVWEHCSLVYEKPTTLSENNYSQTEANSFGEKLKTSIISTTNPGNSRFWTLRDLAFREGAFDKEGASNFFNKNDGRKDIKTFCSEAYKKPSSSSEPNENEIKRYCSLD